MKPSSFEECPECEGVGSTLEAKGSDVECAACQGSGFASPVMKTWITELSHDKRTCKLFGFVCYCDFQISLKEIRPLARSLIFAAKDAMVRGMGWSNDVDIAIYDEDGGVEIRAWPVFRHSYG